MFTMNLVFKITKFFPTHCISYKVIVFFCIKCTGNKKYIKIYIFRIYPGSDLLPSTCFKLPACSICIIVVIPLSSLLSLLHYSLFSACMLFCSEPSYYGFSWDSEWNLSPQQHIDLTVHWTYFYLKAFMLVIVPSALSVFPQISMANQCS